MMSSCGTLNAEGINKMNSGRLQNGNQSWSCLLYTSDSFDTVYQLFRCDIKGLGSLGNVSAAPYLI